MLLVSHTPGPLCPSAIAHSEPPSALFASGHWTFAEAPVQPAASREGLSPGSSSLLPAPPLLCGATGGCQHPVPTPLPGCNPSRLPYWSPGSGRFSKAAALSLISIPAPSPSCPVPPFSPLCHLPRAHLSLTAFVRWDPGSESLHRQEVEEVGPYSSPPPQPNQLPWAPSGLGSPHQCLLQPRAR